MVQVVPLRTQAAPANVSAAMRPLVWPLVIAAAIIGLLASAAVLATYNFHRDREAARIEALSDLRAGQVGNWLADKQAQVGFAGNSPLGELFLRWQVEGDDAARTRLISRLASFRVASGGQSVLVTDDRGQILASEPAQTGPAAPELLAAIHSAVRKNAPQFTPLYRSAGAPPDPRIDVISPLFLSGTPARGLVVLRLDPRESLFTLLNQWPVPSQTGQSLLVRVDGDAIVGAFGRTRAPLSTPDLLAAKVLRGEAPFGKAIEALDFRGGSVLGVVRPVKGTDWFLVSKVDRHEVFAEARMNLAWIGIAGLLALIAVGAGAHWWRERHALRFARQAGMRQEADRQRLEALVEQRTREIATKNSELERTVSDLDAFSASVSHDLRAPLRTVQGFAAILERSEGAKLSDEGRRKLGRILAGAATMDRMIEDILECARADRAEMDFEPIDLGVLVRDVVAELSPAYPGTQVVVGRLPTVHADAGMAQRVFANLIGNALKFSARAAQPLVEIGMLEESHEDSGRARLFVRDNGVGFNPAEAGKLFTPFQRLHSGDDFPGTGVGLSIVRRLIERHGGSITAESAPGRETKFTFDFGLADRSRTIIEA